MIFQQNLTTFRADRENSIITLGGIDAPFYAQMHAVKNNEHFTITHPDAGAPSFVGDIVESVAGNKKHRFYDAGQRIQWDIEYAGQLPNEEIFDIDFEVGTVFSYQPPLTEEPLSNLSPGVVSITETETKDIEGNILDYRPADVCGSFAIYCNKKHNQYQTGKLAHIYAFYLVDSIGQKFKVPVTVNQITKKLTAHILAADEWIKTVAVGSIKLDPTFGYATAGASNASLNNTYMWGDGDFTPASSGDCESISIYSNRTGSINYTLGIYDATPSALHRDTAGEARTFLIGGSWELFNLDSVYAVSSSSSYWFMEGADNTTTFFYDTVAGAGGYTDNHAYSSGTLPDPITMDSTAYGRQISIYATYTSGGTPVSQTFASPFEVLGGVTVDHISNLEALQSIAAARQSNIEALSLVSQVHAVAFECLGYAVVSAEFVTPIESAGRVTASPLIAVEALQSVDVQHTLPVETLQTVGAPFDVRVESLQTISRIGQSAVECLATITLDTAANFEGLQSVSGTATLSIEVLQGVSQATGVPIEALLGTGINLIVNVVERTAYFALSVDRTAKFGKTADRDAGFAVSVERPIKFH